MEISAPELKRLITENAEAIHLIDCRDAEEWRLCHIEGSELIPLSEFAQKTADWDPADKRKKIIYCHHGIRSLQATIFLRTKGFEDTYSLQGGIDAWSVEVNPMMPRY
ncbi:MAG: sulfurtransferase [Verrucomicrobiaceae bacterium]|nr:sulfurtransferase [Verrucomicrobiaceae bacterium]